MAYNVAVGSIMELTVMMRLYNQRIMLVRHYRIDPEVTEPITDGGGALAEYMSSFDAAVGGITSTLATYTTTDLQIESIRGQWIWPTRYSYQFQAPTANVGTQPPPTLPQNIAVVGTLQTDGAGRSGHGNVFLAGFSEAQTADGYVTALGQGHIAIIMQSLKSNITSAIASRDTFPIIYHRASPGVSGPITHYTVQQTLRTQRRRTVGRGI